MNDRASIRMYFWYVGKLKFPFYSPPFCSSQMSVEVRTSSARFRRKGQQPSNIKHQPSTSNIQHPTSQQSINRIFVRVDLTRRYPRRRRNMQMKMRHLIASVALVAPALAFAPANQKSCSTSTTLAGSLHGEDACFLPLKQCDQDWYAPRIVQVSMVD